MIGKHIQFESITGRRAKMELIIFIEYSLINYYNGIHNSSRVFSQFSKYLYFI